MPIMSLRRGQNLWLDFPTHLAFVFDHPPFTFLSSHLEYSHHFAFIFPYSIMARTKASERARLAELLQVSQVYRPSTSRLVYFLSFRPQLARSQAMTMASRK